LTLRTPERDIVVIGIIDFCLTSAFQTFLSSSYIALGLCSETAQSAVAFIIKNITD
jgi:hypothetical protein